METGDLIGLYYPRGHSSGIVYYEILGRRPVLIPSNDLVFQEVCAIHLYQDDYLNINLDECGSKKKKAIALVL